MLFGTVKASISSNPSTRAARDIPPGEKLDRQGQLQNLEPDKPSITTHHSGMNMVSEYRLQTLGGVLLTLLGFLHWVMVGFMTKFADGRDTLDTNHLALFVRQIGILALAIPIVWAVYTIKKERDPKSRWTRRYTILSGFVAAFAMFYLLGKSLTYGRERGSFTKGASIHAITKPVSGNPRHVS